MDKPAIVAYVGGHVVLLWALGMEVLGWAARTAPLADYVSFANVSLSILMAGYGLMLVALGVLARSPINRILGLGLLAIVVVKLYVYDIWLLERMFRVIAFSALGVLLLVTSFLYSRFREAIENWWRHDQAHS